jgi:hypothetical protein
MINSIIGSIFMRLGQRFILLFLLAFTFVYALENNDDDGYQFEALKAWIATKRQVTIKERGGSLSLSGDLRSEYTTSNEQKNGFKNIGTSSYHPLIASDQFRIAFNMLLDYRAEATWASVKLKFSNSMGVISGTNNRLNLERAFIGFRVVDSEKFTVDLEPGRRKLNYTFDSRIEFSALMDGLLIKYDQSSDRYGDFYIHGGPFVVNDIKNLFAYVMETGIYKIYNTGFYVKYALTDWYTKHFNSAVENARFEYFVNQVLLGYRFNAPGIDKVSIFYAAFLINSAAPKRAIFNNKKSNKATYVGFAMGEARKKGDWALDSNFQWVQPQAIPDFDFGGIGAGTAISTIYETTSYIGGLFEFLYLITDNLTISQQFKYSKSLDILPNRYTYKQYRLEFIYAW